MSCLGSPISQHPGRILNVLGVLHSTKLTLVESAVVLALAFPGRGPSPKSAGMYIILILAVTQVVVASVHGAHYQYSVNLRST